MESNTQFRASAGVLQVAYIVQDIELEMERWTRMLRVGPFFYMRHFPLFDAFHRGAPTTLDLDVAVAFSGDMCFELLRQNDDSPSVYREVVAARGYGFHHWALGTRTFDADIAHHESAGTEIVAHGFAGVGGRVAYVDTFATLGGFIELIELTPPVDEFLAMVHSASRSWDGTDPIRRLGAR